MSNPNKQQWCLFIAWLIALISMLITLYASDILNIPACHLCWYQRICIYPLTIILGIACYRNDPDVTFYSLPLAALGSIFGLLQYLEQIIPGFSPIDVCGLGPSCSDIHIHLLGFITFPLLSIIACGMITMLLILTRSGK
jgi:disulfide bond formation protein DsbB